MKDGGLILWNATVICENVQDFLEDGKTPYERRFGEPLKGPIVPFGAMVDDHPSSPKMSNHQFGKRVLPGIFLGYELIAW